MTEKIKVVITDNQKTVKAPKGLRMLIRRCCLATLRLRDYQGSAEVDVFFTDNEGIAAVNEEFFGDSSVVGALSVPIDRDGVLGAVYISLERADELGQAYGTSLQRETVYLTVNGVLNILERDAEPAAMRDMEERIMFEMGFPMSTAYALSN